MIRKSRRAIENLPNNIIQVRVNVAPPFVLVSTRSLTQRRSRHTTPDANSNDDNASIKFQEISRAYQILMDPQLRQKYDRELQLLEPGQLLSITLEIDYEMSKNGGEKWVHMRSNGICEACGGSGMIRGDSETCHACGGQGMCKQTRRMTVKIPPGVQNRDKLCVVGQGVDGTPPGNLYVSLIVWDKESVDGPEMWSSYETISYVDAVLGTGSSFSSRQSYWPTGYTE
jgi:DnaJ-class molecular chaperone